MEACNLLHSETGKVLRAAASARPRSPARASVVFLRTLASVCTALRRERAWAVVGNVALSANQGPSEEVQ